MVADLRRRIRRASKYNSDKMIPMMEMKSSDLEIVDYTFAVEEIICHREEIPV